MRIILRIYAVTALIVAAVWSPLGLAFVPILLLVWFLYLWRWPSSHLVDYLTQYFIFFAIGLLFSGIIGPYFAVLISLPQVAAIDRKLRDIGRITIPDAGNGTRSMTNIGLLTISITIGILIIGLIVWNVALILACGVTAIYFLSIILVIWQRFDKVHIIAEPIQLRTIVGREVQRELVLIRKSELKGMLFLNSSYPWVKVVPNAFIPLETGEIRIKVSATPSLAGPTDINLNACIIDPWGLSQVRFAINTLKLAVIPRARYADWLARRYLTGSKLGRLPLVSDVGEIKSLYGLRQGIEFYGNRMYQPGDNLKNIDWKHSVKYHELVTKEFFEIQGQPVIILINLVASNAEETDKLAYNIIVASLSLARDGIPAALAAYNDQGVILSTGALAGQILIVRALEIVKEIVTKENTTRTLQPPDVGLLRANIRRLINTENPASGVLICCKLN